MNENFTFEELVARANLCSELLEIIKNCENEGLSAAATMGTVEGQIEIIKIFCETRINSELERMEKEVC